MNRIKAILTLSAAIAAAAASAPALAWGHARLSFGVVVGAPFYPWYYPPYYYYPPAVVAVPTTPTTYVERDSPGPAPSQHSSYWYYCQASKTYYPYVKDCPAGWMRVVPQATPPSTRAAPQANPPTTPQLAPQDAQQAVQR